MAGYKNGKIMLPIKEFLIVKGQAIYELNTIDMTKVTVFYRKYNQEAFLETYSEMPKGDYRINEVGGNKQFEITNLDILDEYYSIQLARVVDLTSSPYSPSGQVDPITLNQHLNEVIADVTFLFTYLKDVGMVMDSSSGNKILAELKPYTTWYMDKDGNMAAMPVDSLFEKFNDLVQELRQEVLKLLEQDLEVAERELLEGVKTQLDEYVETDLKQRLDDYTTQLEERLQTMIDQAVADKGLMPEGSDWLEIGLGNWLVVDLFNKNYIHYPPQLNSSDNAGVVKKDITDGGKSQVIRYYTATGKMLFVVRVNEVWSEWQELGGQTDTMQFTQANHGFIFTAVTLDGAIRKWVKANKYTSADGIAIKIDNDRFDVVTRGVVNIPTSARDDKGNAFVYDEYYFLSQEVDGGLSRTKNEIGTFQYLAHISEIDGKQVAYIDIGDSYDLDYEVVDTETADRVGIGTYKTTLRTADTIEGLKRLNLKVGDVVEVLGYYTKRDGADHKRKIESKDDGSGVLLDNGLYANIVHNGEVNISWFGAKGDIEEAQDIYFNKAFSVPTVKTVKFNKTYYVENLTLKYNKNFIGDKKTAILKPTLNSNCVLTIRREEANCIIGGFDIVGLKSDGNKVKYGCDFHYFHYGSEFRDFNINQCQTGIILNECWSSIYRNFRIQNCDIAIHFNNTKVPNLSRIDGNINDNLFIRGMIQWCSTGVYFEHPKSFGLQNSFKQIHFEVVDKAFYSKYYSGILSVDGVSFEQTTWAFYSEGLTGGNIGYVSIDNIMYLCQREETTVPFELKGQTGHFKLSGRFSTSSDMEDYTQLQHIVKIENGRSFTVNLASTFSKEHIARNFFLYDVNCQIVNGIVEKTSANSPRFSANKYECSKLTMQGNQGYNVSSDAEILFNGYDPDYNNERINAFKIIMSKDNNYAIGRPKIQVRIDENWNDALVFEESQAKLYGKKILVEEPVTTLNTPFYVEMMEQEGGTTKQDFYTYLGEKNKYDKQVEAEEKAKYEAYQQALTTNPNLTYEEFIASYSMMLTNIEEPTIPQSVQEFMKKYL